MTEQDQAHLKALSICWYVYAGLTCIGALCGGLYIVIGIFALMAGMAENEDEAVVMGIAFSVGGLIAALISGGFALMFFLAGKGLSQFRRKTLIYVSAVLACLNVPLGTILGIFTFIVMGRPTVKAAFDGYVDQGYDDSQYPPQQTY